MSVIRLVLLGLALVGSRAAYACSCNSTPVLFPSNALSGVPTNVVLRALYRSSAPPAPVASLEVEGSGAPLELESVAGPTSFLRSFKPRAVLTPNTRYTFVVDEQVITFTTGEGEDHEAPGTPSFDAVTFTQTGTPSSASCGINRRWALTYTGGDDAQTPADSLLVFAQSTGSDEPADAVGVTTGEARALAIGMCNTNFQHPEGSSQPVALQVMDLAGNVSAPSSTRQAASCATAPGVLVAPAALWLRRRNPPRAR